MKAIVNAPYKNRIQLVCDPYFGPFVNPVPEIGDFDPTRDLEVYVDGKLIKIQSFTFDTLNNRYLLFTENNINLEGVIQVIHHMPNPPFQANVNPPIYGLTYGENPGEGSTS